MLTHAPDTLFGILHSRTADGWSTRMVPGPWMTDADGHAHRGTIALLADIGLSMPILFNRVDRSSAPVTSVLSIDFVPGANLFDGPLTADADILHADSGGALTRGEVRSASGALVAIGSIAARLQPLPAGYESLDESFPLSADPELTLTSIFRLEPARTADGLTVEVVAEPWLCSPRGTMHGGIVAMLADHFGAMALSGGAGRWSTSSMRTSYLRPTLVDSTFRAVATVVQEGRSLAIVRVRTEGSNGKLLTTTDLAYLAR